MQPDNDLRFDKIQLVSRLCLGLAWLLLLIGIFLPMGEIQMLAPYAPPGGAVPGSIYGFQVAIMAPLASVYVFGLILDPTANSTGWLLLGLITVPMIELLFLASPFILFKAKPERVMLRKNYFFLNILCALLMLLPLSLVGKTYDLHPVSARLLPGMFVWFAAQVILLLASGIQLGNIWFSRS